MSSWLRMLEEDSVCPSSVQTGSALDTALSVTARVHTPGSGCPSLQALLFVHRGSCSRPPFDLLSHTLIGFDGCLVVSSMTLARGQGFPMQTGCLSAILSPDGRGRCPPGQETASRPESAARWSVSLHAPYYLYSQDPVRKTTRRVCTYMCTCKSAYSTV